MKRVFHMCGLAEMLQSLYNYERFQQTDRGYNRYSILPMSPKHHHQPACVVPTSKEYIQQMYKNVNVVNND